VVLACVPQRREHHAARRANAPRLLRIKIQQGNARHNTISAYEERNSEVGCAKIDDAMLRSTQNAASPPDIATLRDKRSPAHPI